MKEFLNQLNEVAYSLIILVFMGTMYVLFLERVSGSFENMRPFLIANPEYIQMPLILGMGLINIVLGYIILNAIKSEVGPKKAIISWITCMVCLATAYLLVNQVLLK